MQGGNPMYRNGSRRNPLDDLLSDEELRAEARKAEALAESRNARSLPNTMRDSARRRVYNSMPVSVLVIAGAVLVTIGVMIGQRFGSQHPNENLVRDKQPERLPDSIAPTLPEDSQRVEPKEENGPPPSSEPFTKQENSPPRADVLPLDSEEVFKRARPAVVRVVLRNGRQRPVSHGTGFFVRDGSTILTNFHVVAGKAAAEVELHDRSTVPVIGIEGFDPMTDIAVLRIGAPQKEIQPLRLSDRLPSIREKVSVIGYPLDLGITNRNGEIAGLDGHRERTGRPWVQIDAPINPGNSGSPVLNEDGLVVGIATFIDTRGDKLHFASPATSATVQLERDVPLRVFADLHSEDKKFLSTIRASISEKPPEAIQNELNQLPDWFQHFGLPRVLWALG